MTPRGSCLCLAMLLTLSLVVKGNARPRSLSSSRLLRRFHLSSAEQRALLEAAPASALHQLAAPQGLSSTLFEPPPPRQGIPDGVECEAKSWCDKTGICSSVCARGSVVQSSWQQWATAFQLSMARKQPLCYTQLLATHNSAITLADGYGNRDPVYSAYLRWLKTLGAATEMHTNNQWLSVTDQLNLGVRVLELDVHFVAGELRIAHCGGLHSSSLNRVVSLINAVAKLLGRPEMTWDAETVGCSPSLSSIAVTDQRLLGDALEEVAAWMKEPRNAHELLVLFFDDQPDLARWNKVPDFLEQLTRSFPEDWILTPPDARTLMEGRAADGAAVPSIEELVAQGKRLVLLSGTDYKQEMERLVFSNDSMPVLCPYGEPWMSQFTGFTPAEAPAAQGAAAAPGGHKLGTDMCVVSHHGRRPSKPEPLFVGKWLRMPSCELMYGPMDCHFRMGKHNEGMAMNASALAQVTECGLNFPAPDLLTPSRAAAHIWNWAESHPPTELLAAAAGSTTGAAALAPGLLESAGCAYADAVDGRWRTDSCDEVDEPAPGHGTLIACRSTSGVDVPESQRRQLIASVGSQGVSLQEGDSAEASKLWILVPRSTCQAASGGQDCCPAGSTHDAPRNAMENLLLRQALQALKAGRALLPLRPPSYLPPWMQVTTTTK